MSGGAFDYTFLKIREMTENLRRAISENTPEPNPASTRDPHETELYLERPHPNLNLQTLRAVATCTTLLEISADAAKSVEHLYSADIGHQTFQTQMKDILERLEGLRGML
jgi:hypothetical protein